MTLLSGVSALRRGLISSVYTRPLPLGNQQPVVSFCFDDFPRSAYTAGGAILKSFGVRGTYYAALGLVNTTNELGDQLRYVDIESLLKDGHELGSHTFHHSSCRRLSPDAFEDDVIKGREALRDLTGYDAGNFAYPFGHTSIRCKQKIGMQVNSARGIYGGVNGPKADLNLLRANSLYGNVSQSHAIEALISENVKRRGWLIFYTHDVRPNPSHFGCTPALLDRTVMSAEKSGCRIVSIKAAISMFRGTSGEPAFKWPAGNPPSASRSPQSAPTPRSASTRS